MARPQKEGLDYFPLDVQMDDNVALIEAEHGITGFGILIKLFQKIYAEGYYYDWTEKEQLLFSKRVSVDRNQVESVVSDAIKWGIFDKKLYEKYQILTSKGIQKRYCSIIYKRSKVEMIKEYLLIDVKDKKNIEAVSKYDVNNRVSDDRNQDTNNVSDVESTQSKVKESKVNKIIRSKTIKPIKINDKYTSNSNYMQLAQKLKQFILKNNPNAKVQSNLQSWADTFRKIIEIDNRQVKEVYSILKFSQEHDFWYKNILSADKFRKQYDRLYLEYQDGSSNRKNSYKNNNKFLNFSQDDYEVEYFMQKVREKNKNQYADKGG